MSELLVLALKFAFLALLWTFILFTGNVIRTDLLGRKVPTSAPASAPAGAPASAPAGASPVAAPALTPAPVRLSRRERKAAKQTPTTLRITQGKQAGLTMPLGEILTIGRSADCQLILDDDYVSTHHARIVRTSAGYVVEDLGSTNGSYLNDVRISSPTAFTLADTLRIGRTLLVVER